MAASVTKSEPRKGFIRKVTIVAAWGQGLDGYDLGVISVALPFIISDLQLSSTWAGLLGASSLIGIFFGAPLFGWFTDKTGRRITFMLDLAIFLVAAVVQIVATSPLPLFIVRFALGLAIGAEYSIGAPMLSEFSPTKGRGFRISGLEVSWYLGYLIAVSVSYALIDIADVHWRYVLATGAVPALICLILRQGIPESPRWLVGKGRTDEARAIVDEHLGGEFFDDEELEGEDKSEGRGTFRELFAPGQRSRTIFACTFYACLVAPYFAIFTFAPVVLKALHLTDPAIGTIATNAFAVVGVTAGMFAIERVGRRNLLIGPFWITAVALFVVGFWSSPPVVVIAACFLTFALFNSAASVLTPVYPNELFPTRLRSTGTGFATAASRVGAAAGTFLLPIGLVKIGVGPTMIIAAVICVIGALTTHWLAPETTGVNLTRAAKLTGPRAKPVAAQA